MNAPRLQTGDTVWIDLAGKRRPGVVIEVRQDWYRIAYGTTTIHPQLPEPAVVSPETRQGRRFPLTEVTYFYGANTMLELLDLCRPGQGACSLELTIEIRQLVEEHDARVRMEASE